MAKPVLYDGDMGGDDLWALAILLGYGHILDLIGISTVFGNVSQPNATQNVMNFLNWLGRNDIEVAQGEDMPIDKMRPFGDDAYGSDGIGGIKLLKSPKSIQKVDIADWIYQKISEQSEKTTLFVTGPATNIAKLVQKHSNCDQYIEKIIFMGGAHRPPAKDGIFNGRIGNITPFSEFNAYQDPESINIVVKSGIPFVFMPMDATQYLVFDEKRQQEICTLNETYGPALRQMIMVVADLDIDKFGVGPFIHDPNVVAYALRPELYGSSPDIKSVSVQNADPRGDMGEHRGEIIPRNASNNQTITWLNGMTDPDAVFELMKTGLKRTIEAAKAYRVPLEG